MAKHTPGPWRLIPHGNETYPFSLTIHDVTGENWIARDGTVSSIANARLIAAAPTMLEALDDMVMICGRTGNALDDFEEQAERFHRETGVMRPGKDMAAASSGESDDGKRRARYNEWIEEKIANARAAIAKAGG